jgi:hypothetical protein
MYICDKCLYLIKRKFQIETIKSLTILFKIGNRILAHARLLVNSVNIALVIITKRITIIFGAPIIKRRNVAIVLDKSDA